MKDFSLSSVGSREIGSLRDSGPTAEDWFLCINFYSAGDIIETYGTWPYHVLTPRILADLYNMPSSTPLEREPSARSFFKVLEGRIAPAFPFLGEEEGRTLEGFFGNHRREVYPPVKDLFLRLAGIESPAPREASHGTGGLSDKVLLIFQHLLILRLREEERKAGLWEKRTPAQKKGTLFALNPSSPTTFTRIKALPVGRDMRLAFPWGGIYKAYGKLLPLMENRYTRFIFSTADENLRMLIDGHVLKPLLLSGLMKLEGNIANMQKGGYLIPNVPSVRWSEIEGLMEEISMAAREVARKTRPLIPDLMDLWRSSRYSYLDGHGDFLEMAYTVLLGLLISWANQDGVLPDPPEFSFAGNYAAVKRTFWEILCGRYPPLPGIVVLKDAKRVWDGILEQAGRLT